MRNNAAGMAHEQESGMATHQFPIGQHIHEERGSQIKKELFSFINWQICKSGVSRTLLLNAHFFRRRIYYQSYGWAFVTESGVVTFLFTHFTQILVSQSTSHLLSLKRDATRFPSFRGCAVSRIPLVHSGPVFLI